MQLYFGMRESIKLNILIGTMCPNIAAKLERQHKVTFGFHAA